MSDYIKENLDIICENINIARQKAFREGEDIKIVAVTKTVSPDNINTAINAGIKIIGENKVQEYVIKKKEIIPVKKHFIGLLQTNKVKDVVNDFSLIHSVDRQSLVIALQKEAFKKNISSINILVQVNIGDEETKSGVNTKKIEPLLETIMKNEKLNLVGLMCVPPISTGIIVRKYFEQLRIIKESMKKKYKKELQNFNELSMGMSQDYVEAILEGATYVRIGTGIFGNRNYS